MTETFDSLGRRKPKFDRSKAGKKGAATAKVKYGNDFHARIGADGGSRRTRGYLGKLKDEGKTVELKAVTQKGATAKNKAQAAKKRATNGIESAN
jgi:hypothetical protein